MNNIDELVAGLLEKYEYELGQPPVAAKKVIDMMIREAILETRRATLWEAADDYEDGCCCGGCGGCNAAKWLRDRSLAR